MTDPAPSDTGDANGIDRSLRTRSDASRPRGSTAAAERLERETAARRVLFVASVAGVMGAFGLIAAGERPVSVADVTAPAATAATAGNRVLAETTIGPMSGAADERIIVRIVAADPEPPVAHVRTRATS